MALENYTLQEQVALESLAEENQNFRRGIIAGVIAGVLCAAVWASITIATKVQVSFTALLLGAAVGYSMWVFGKGMEEKVGLWAALIAVGSIVFGNLLILQ